MEHFSRTEELITKYVIGMLTLVMFACYSFMPTSYVEIIPAEYVEEGPCLTWSQAQVKYSDMTDMDLLGHMIQECPQ